MARNNTGAAATIERPRATTPAASATAVPPEPADQFEDPGEELDAKLTKENAANVAYPKAKREVPAPAEPEPYIATGVACAGIVPFVGMPVWFWQEEAGRLIPLPGILMDKSPIGENWTLNVQILGGVSVRSDKPFSESPKRNHWTWPKWTQPK